MREHDVTTLTARDLERARRELTASLALTRPGSPARTPILAHLTAIDIELTRRTGQQPDRPSGSPRAWPDGRRGLRMTSRHPGPNLQDRAVLLPGNGHRHQCQSRPPN